MIVHLTTTHMFKVEEKNTFHAIYLLNWICECREFDLIEIPYRHACATVRYAKYPKLIIINTCIPKMCLIYFVFHLLVCFRRAGLQVTDIVAYYYK